ncbi:adenylyl cyclase-associated protein 2 isoform X2 [Fasciola gigantica]|uniref:Adenylyl cyclase-associated protein 2 isoform X2 n=1 Tax=Fasciola gigantica TaxID=46835 RepID=A0A504YCH2_FASGI|nr:adenylyl cyclase-associated protein 2 isoform X2 [Fasciola gigantica]
MDKFETLLDRLERVTGLLESLTSRASIEAAGEAKEPLNHFTAESATMDSASVRAYDQFLSGPVAEFISLSSDIGGDVKEQSVLLQKCFTLQKQLLTLVAQYSKPTDSEFSELVKVYTEPISTVVNFKDSHRSSPFFNHISAVAESVLSLGWVAVTPTPAPHVKNMQEAAQFFTNRVMKDYKEKDAKHIKWTKKLMEVWDSLFSYIKQYHTTGLSWNARGTRIPASALRGSPPAGDVPPPPPPLPPMPVLPDLPQTKSAGGPGGRNALFAEINRGESVTAGLRKVTDDMKTHKNPALRVASDTPVKPPKPTQNQQVPRQIQSTPQKGVLELRGNKWVVENFTNQTLHINETQTKQTVYVYKCTGSTLQIKNKVNSIMIDSCKKTGVVFEHLISSLDVVNCQSVQVQSMGQLATVNIDKTDGCQVYLSKDSKFANIITAKSSEVNLLIPNDNMEFEEFPVPEQFLTKFTGKGIQTTCMESA